MTNKKRGTRAEQYVVNFLKDRGYQAFRIPSSGSGTKDYRPDVVAGYPGNYEIKPHRLIIEVKRTKDNFKYISKESLKELDAFAYSFDAIPTICINFNKTYLWWLPLCYWIKCEGKMQRFDKENGRTFNEFRKKEAGL
ncbi:TPA_asm: Holliday junction resolvase [Caudoviricetes sp. vir520]|nr:TPA_asm: Holliday junction resolvase [Caudoviricetes sp. vir520]